MEPSRKFITICKASTCEMALYRANFRSGQPLTTSYGVDWYVVDQDIKRDVVVFILESVDPEAMITHKIPVDQKDMIKYFRVASHQMNGTVCLPDRPGWWIVVEEWDSASNPHEEDDVFFTLKRSRFPYAIAPGMIKNSSERRNIPQEAVRMRALEI